MTSPKIQAFTYVQKNSKKVDFEVLQENTEVRLWRNTSDTEINSLLLNFFGYQIKFGSKIKMKDILKEIVNTKFPDFAFLKFTNSNSLELYSGCCFNFSDWKALENVTPKNYDIWLGHSPMVAIKFDEKNNRYLVWDSEDNNLDYVLETNEYIEFEIGELQNAVKSFKEDLIDFGNKIETWSKQFDKTLAHNAVKKIKLGIGIEEKI